MRTERSRDNDSVRIHAIVLTSNRPNSLARCVTTARRSLGPDDLLTVLDDSTEEMSAANMEVIRETARNATSSICHIRVVDLCFEISSVSPGDREWLSKTALRDIAPFRNIELLLSKAIPARTTILIDDDIHSFDLTTTHHFLDAHESSAKEIISGGRILGMSELDTLTRLSEGLLILERHPAANDETVVFQAHRVDDTAACRWVSAGYMAFRLSDSNTFAFPPGYNEDWLWCLLHNSTTSVVYEDQCVVHDPPSVRSPSRDDLQFELSGDLILDCLSECDGVDSDRMIMFLRILQNHIPSSSLMPTTRVQELLEQYDTLATRERVSGFQIIERNGMTVARDMLLSGELEMDGSELLHKWCRDTLVKQRSFALAMHNRDVITFIKQTVETGILKWNRT